MRGREGWPPRWSDITDPAVRAALAATPRHLFVPPELRDEAYEDIALPIGQGQTISQPYIVALMTQALRLTPDSRVLEIGTGSGYQTAILAHITPHVWSVEVLPELARAAGERLQGLGCPAMLKVGDGSLGWPEYAPYDAVMVTAAGAEIPPALVQQLAPGGRLVMPVGGSAWDQMLWLVEKGPDDALYAERLAEVRFVPLVARRRPPDADPALAALRRRLHELLTR
ncbi:MAG: Protein-L-isoaspartate O-methyltransferase [Chloroflexi bacterium ADurb.Bin325]|nr:MAG: Protein-L-isoaspartate O-methyltransferase [Chloroflexi bacterium ADurb.Bin325]